MVLKVAVIGSGPSGFYATEALFRSGPGIEVDMFERLPVPYGLVRSGVAPDHPRLKQPVQVFAKIAETSGFGFFGNVTVGKDIAVETLKSLYHAVVVTCGAESDRRLGIPGENLPGSHTAMEFVGWYNGHPDFRDRRFDLSHDTAVILGQGNVAADLARILAKSPDELKHTDIADHALEVLTRSRIREIHVIGRRGPAQAKFTSRELKEFGDLDGCRTMVDENELALNPESEIELADKSNANGKNVYELLARFAIDGACVPKHRRVRFTFLKSPRELMGKDRVERIRLEVNSLTGEPFSQSAQGTGRFIELEAGIVFCSIGYRGTPIPGLPFDGIRGIIPHRDGRIIDGTDVVPNFYAAGWIKRGPTGIIGTNRADSVATVQALLQDLRKIDSSTEKGGRRDMTRMLRHQGVRFVSFADWQRIDQREMERGLPKAKPREKFTRIPEMLGAADEAGAERGRGDDVPMPVHP